MSRNASILLALSVFTAAPAAVDAAFSYDLPGSVYSQDFNSLPNSPANTSLGNSPIGWTDDNTTPPAGNFSIPGWYLYHPAVVAEGGANGHQRMRIGAGTANTGAFMSWGAAGSTERGLGMVGSNTLALGPGGTPPDNNENYYGLRLTNNTGQTLGEFTLTFTGEQWRDGGTTTTGSVL
jgi:hypothetical protein